MCRPSPNCTMTRSSKIQAEELASSIRTELNRALDSDTVTAKLVSALKKTLIDEMTPIITKNVTENVREYFDFEIQTRDTRIASLEKKIENLLDQQDEAEQYSRRNCLIFHGLEEKVNENTDETVIKLCEEKMNVKINPRDIDRSHRIGPSKDKKNRGVIVKFTNYKTRDQIYKNRKKLRSSQEGAIFVHESLTKTRSELFWKVKSKYKDMIEALWTQDGRILCILKHTKKTGSDYKGQRPAQAEESLIILFLFLKLEGDFVLC